MRRQHDKGLKYWFAPRENEKPFTESERAQRWRLSLASLLFITVLLSDHLWFCAEAKLTRTRDKRLDEGLAITDMGEYPNSLHRHHNPTSLDPHRLAREQDDIFIGNSTKPLWRMDTCHPDSVSKDCFTFTDAKTVCLGLSGGGEEGTQSAYVNLSDLYLSFCNSYSLLDLFYGFTSPDVMNCTLDMAMGVDLLGCRECVQAYQRLDQQAEENYREFELLVQKYETDVYSVRTCMEECKVRLTRPGRARAPTHARALKGVGSLSSWQPLGISVHILALDLLEFSPPVGCQRLCCMHVGVYTNTQLNTGAGCWRTDQRIHFYLFSLSLAV